MNKITAAVVLASMALPVQAVDEHMMPVFCVDYETLEATVAEWSEIPLLRGLSERGTERNEKNYTMVLFVNKETRSWTLVEQIDPDYYCVIGVGSKFEPVPGEVIDGVIKNQKQKGDKTT
jgi:hypothetical protein